jgi:hypothetical protein
MAAFCWLWRISPAEYWALTLEETEAMLLHVAEEAAKARR